jgi:methane/ammonia monooxygenase subunit B
MTTRRYWRWRRLLGPIVAGLLLAVWTATPALAHGERSQEAFLRMRTVGWLDVTFNKASIAQGDTVTITGTAKIMDQWPDTLAAGEPGIGHIGVIAPGPVVVLKERTVNGVSTPGRIEIEKGNYYQFSMTIAGRKVGRWHVHPAFAVKGAGTVLGPGQWVEVTENPNGYVNTATLYNGETINLENYGLPAVWGWQVVTFLIGIAWMLYWTVPKFHRTVTNLAVTSQIPLNDDGVAVGLNSRRDHRVVNWFAIVTIVLMAIAWVWQAAAFPVKMPQQVVQFAPPVSEAGFVDTATVKTGRATFDPQTDRLTMQVEVTNTGEQPIRLAEFATSTLTFENQGVSGGQPERQLQVEPATEIAPGATTQLTLSMVEGAFESEHMIPVGEANLTVAGMLIFADSAGARVAAEVDAIVRPVF